MTDAGLLTEIIARDAQPPEPGFYDSMGRSDRRALLRMLREAQRDADRYRYWRTHQYNGLLDVDERCDENSPQALHFDRLTDGAMASQLPEAK